MAEKQNCERMSEENFRKLLIPSPLTLEDVKVIINSDPKISANLPTRYYKNPITGCVIASCDKRDFRPNTLFDDKGKPKCPICLGDTTQIIFFEPIGNNAYAFGNENLFPIVSPNPMKNTETGKNDIYGYHFLIWPSTEHKELQELTPEEHVSTFHNMKTLENLTRGGENILFIKNKGEPCGNSIDHDHYQVIISNFLSTRRLAEEEYFRKNGFSLVECMRKSSSSRKLADYGSFDVTIPYYMRRGLEAVIAPVNKSQSRFNDLSEEELYDFSKAIIRTTERISRIMDPKKNPKYKFGLAYNFVFHTGNIGTMYLEILPYTQAEGGYEKAGFDANQSTTERTQKIYEDCLKCN